ncbi:MAG TPA: hypothetical protein VGA06_00485 [Candidatus Paceibacterota bacterium]|jgi:hypothetical protein
MLTLALILHVILGLIAVGASYAAVMLLLKRTIASRWLTWSAGTAFLAYLLSWLTGGYYYVVYYGFSVKPIIKAGAYPWAHGVVMEVKEHIFLFLPVLAFLVFLATLLPHELETDSMFRRSILLLSVIVFVLGLAIALGGIIVSGAVR